MNNFKNFFSETLKTAPVENWFDLVANDDYLKTAVDLMHQIEKLGGEALIVGGAVRDILLKKPAHDIDIATNVDINEIEKTFKTHDIGKSKDFGIVTVKWGNHVYEVANFREEAGYSDNRRPDQVTKVKSFEKDSERRDLTFNALGLNKEGVIIDYQNGIDDLKNKIVKAVGNAQERFIEDSLRIIRVARFAAKFGFQIEPQTRQAMIELAHLVDNVSAERVHDELFKIAEVSGDALANYIEHLDDVGILERILPEIKEMQKYEHTRDTHPEGDVFPHVMAALRASQSSDPVTNLAILFHDIGKTVTRTYTDAGKVSYKGHETAGMPLFEKIAARLKFSNKEKEAILFAMEHHMKGHKIRELKSKTILNLRQNPNWPHLQQTMRADDASRGAPMFNSKEFDERIEYIEGIFKKFGETQEFERKMSALVNGQLIMKLIPGIQGANIGRVKNLTRDWIISRDFNVTGPEVTEYILNLAK